MKVRILSGNQAGAMVEMRPDEADLAIATGYGQAAPVTSVPVTPEPESKQQDDSKQKKKGQRP